MEQVLFSPIHPGNINDIPRLVRLINNAYRKNESGAWTTEADLFSDDTRIDESGLDAVLQQPENHILKYESGDGNILGTVCLTEKKDCLYLGMLAVSPQHQGDGIGKKLLLAAKDFARRHGFPKIIITVISVRTELIAWYERFGFYRTGNTEPFPTDGKLNKPKKPLFFEEMRLDV